MLRHTVLLTTEGTYPCYRGGVSVWCDQLVRNLQSVDFHILAINQSPLHQPVFHFSPNVIGYHPVPLWGTEEAGWAPPLFSQALMRKRNTTQESIERGFAPAFSSMCRALVSPRRPEELAKALVELHQHFSKHDYAQTMCSQQAWRIFCHACRTHMPGGSSLTMADATACMRWLQRYLSVLSLPIPAVDITHASIAGLAGIPGIINKFQHGSAFVLTEHGIYLRELYVALHRMQVSDACRRFLVGFHGALVRMNYHYADVVTSLCEFNRKWQVRLGAVGERIQIVPNGVDPEIFRPRPECLPAQPTVLVMARIFALKGIDVVLRAASLVRDRVPDVQFTILGDVGDAAYHAQCMQIVEEHRLHKTVTFSHTTKPSEAYGKAHVFCLPSISEGMPFSVLEAMLSGVPVVASDVGGVAEVLGKTGILVKPRDHAAFAESLVRLLDEQCGEKLRRDLAGAALTRAASLYTIANCLSKFQQIYESVADERLAVAASA